jgi:hypothetical protein
MVDLKDRASTIDLATLAKYPYLGTITTRKLEILTLLGVMAYPEEVCRSCDLSQTITFTKLTLHVPCITPSGEKYLSSRCRPLLALEAMRLQGIWVDASEASKFDEQVLMSLAGNAFETSCMAASVWSTLIYLARMHTYRCPDPSSVIQMTTAEVQQEASDDEDDIANILGLAFATSQSKPFFRIKKKTTRDR